MAQKRSTFSVAFYIRRTRLNKHGEAAIVVRVTVDGIRGDTTAKKTINPKLWDLAKGKAYERSILAKELNMYLDSIRAKFIRIHRDFEQDDTERITADAVINRFLGKDKPERHTLLEVFREHNEKCHKLSGIDMSPATVERYETSFKHTQEFIQQTYKKDDIYLDEMNRQFIEDYELYLKTVTKEEKDFLAYLYSLVSVKDSLKESTSNLLEKLKETYQEITEDLLKFLSSKTESQEELISQVLQYIEIKNLNFPDVLNKIISACIKLQGNSLYNKQPEDFRNTYIRDLLDSSGLSLKDQSFWGKSQRGTNPGEVDIIVLDTKKTPFCIIEALNLHSLKQKYLEDHIQKLYGYDPTGLKNNIILVYSEVVNFSDFWIKYKAYVISYNFGLDVLGNEEIDSGLGNIKILKLAYKRNDFYTNLYHIIIHLNN